MSYVIQNFTRFNSSIAVTPRFKVIFSLTRSDIFFLFFKFNFLLFIPKYYKFFFKFFFPVGLSNFIYSQSINLSANYINNITFVGAYWNLKLLDDALDTNFSARGPVELKSFFFYNLYFLPIKILNVKLSKTYFKNFFFLYSFFFQWVMKSIS